jgi:hypothetical protein
MYSARRDDGHTGRGSGGWSRGRRRRGVGGRLRGGERRGRDSVGLCRLGGGLVPAPRPALLEPYPAGWMGRRSGLPRGRRAGLRVSVDERRCHRTARRTRRLCGRRPRPRLRRSLSALHQQPAGPLSRPRRHPGCRCVLCLQLACQKELFCSISSGGNCGACAPRAIDPSGACTRGVYGTCALGQACVMIDGVPPCISASGFGQLCGARGSACDEAFTCQEWHCRLPPAVPDPRSCP